MTVSAYWGRAVNYTQPNLYMCVFSSLQSAVKKRSAFMCPCSFVFINVPALVLSFRPALCEWHYLSWVLLMVPTRSQLLELLNRHQHSRVKKTHRKLFPVAFPMLFISTHDFNGCAYFDIIEDMSHFSKVKMLSGLTFGLPGVLAGPFNLYAFLILLLAGGDYFLSFN